MQKMKTKISGIYIKMPISRKITLVYTCVFMVMTIIVSIIAVFNMWISYRSISKNEINAAANKIEDYITSGKTLERNQVEELIGNPYIDVKVFNRNQNPDKNFGTMKEPDMFPNPDTIKPSDRGDAYGSKNVADEPYMFMHRTFEYNEDIYDIIIFRKNTTENKALSLCLGIVIATNLTSILVALLIGRFISKKIVKPIREITQTAENISLYDLSQRIEVPETKDEIQTLVVTFNDMIDRLQEGFEKENRFISDASHELKTPIAIIQGYINMIDRWGKDDAEILKESIDSIKSEAEHMNKLIEQLLYLARDNQGRNNLNIEEVSLAEIAEEVNKEIEVSNPDIVTTFINEADDSIFIQSDAHILKQLIWIFAENGIKYSREEQCHITIKVGYKDNKPYFSVSDNGIGIEKDAFNKIFDRFYRYDESRNKKIKGNGLGLSIAKSISRKINSVITVDSELGKGSTFTVTFN